MSSSFDDNELESVIRRAAQYREHHPELTAAMEAFDPDAAREAAAKDVVSEIDLLDQQLSHLSTTERAKFHEQRNAGEYEIRSVDDPFPKNWFMNMTKKTFKKTFKKNVQVPFQKMLNALEQDPLTPWNQKLYKQLENLLLDFKTYLNLQFQVGGPMLKALKPHFDALTASQPSEKHCLMFTLPSADALRKTFENIVNTQQKSLPYALGGCQPVGLSFLHMMMPGPEFRHQLEPLHAVENEKSFGLIIVIQMQEVMQYPLADTIVCSNVVQRTPSNGTCNFAPRILKSKSQADACMAALVRFQKSIPEDVLKNTAGYKILEINKQHQCCAICLTHYSKKNNLKSCARCKTAWYCTSEHQKLHWPIHKKHCKILQPGVALREAVRQAQNVKQ